MKKKEKLSAENHEKIWTHHEVLFAAAAVIYFLFVFPEPPPTLLIHLSSLYQL